jgi:hypothetical protein
MQERFIDNKDGTILDSVTGLTWQKDTPDLLFTFKQAAEYAKNLDLAGEGWRIPSKLELLGIADREKLDPCISEVFGKTFSEWYWTSTSFYGRSLVFWLVLFNYVTTNSGGVAVNGRVRCVR